MTVDFVTFTLVPPESDHPALRLKPNGLKPHGLNQQALEGASSGTDLGASLQDLLPFYPSDSFQSPRPPPTPVVAYL